MNIFEAVEEKREKPERVVLVDDQGNFAVVPQEYVFNYVFYGRYRITLIGDSNLDSEGEQVILSKWGNVLTFDNKGGFHINIYNRDNKQVARIDFSGELAERMALIFWSKKVGW